MSDRKPLMAGNWKMHHNHLEAIQVVQKLSYRLDKADYDVRYVDVFDTETIRNHYRGDPAVDLDEIALNGHLRRLAS